MRKILFIIILAFSATVECWAKYWVAEVTANVNLRESPSTDNTPILRIPNGSYVAIDDESVVNGFVFANYLDKDEYGYISIKYVKKLKVIEEDQLDLTEDIGGDFTDAEPEIEIENQESIPFTLRVNNSQNYHFNGHDKKTITVPAGKLSLMVSSPGTIPYRGTETVKKNYKYSRSFYLK